MTKYLGAAAILWLAVGWANAATFDGINFPDGEVSFADSVYSYTAGGGFSGEALCQDPTLALGTPDWPGFGTCTGYVSLGFGGTAVFEFTDNYLTTSGDTAADLHIFEIGGAIEPMSVALWPMVRALFPAASIACRPAPLFS